METEVAVNSLAFTSAFGVGLSAGVGLYVAVLLASYPARMVLALLRGIRGPGR